MWHLRPGQARLRQIDAAWLLAAHSGQQTGCGANRKAITPKNRILLGLHKPEEA